MAACAASSTNTATRSMSAWPRRMSRHTQAQQARFAVRRPMGPVAGAERPEAPGVTVDLRALRSRSDRFDAGDRRRLGVESGRPPRHESLVPQQANAAARERSARRSSSRPRCMDRSGQHVAAALPRMQERGGGRLRASGRLARRPERSRRQRRCWASARAGEAGVGALLFGRWSALDRRRWDACAAMQQERRVDASRWLRLRSSKVSTRLSWMASRRKRRSSAGPGASRSTRCLATPRTIS
jgi:hypothetical protein